MISILNTLVILILIYFFTLTIAYTILLLASIPEILNKFKEGYYGNFASLIQNSQLPAVSFIIPAFNERTRIFNCILSVLENDNSNADVIVVSDGSTDDTIELLKERFSLYETPPVIKHSLKTIAKVRHYYRSQTYRNLFVIDKEHSHSADTVNVGVNVCRTPLFITFDADTVLEPGALTRMLFTFLSKPHCLAIGGAIYIINDNEVVDGKMMETNMPKHFIPAVQSVEYLRSFLYGRSGWSVLGGALCYAGAFTLLEKEAVVEVGGYDTKNFSYDAEIIVKLHHYMRKNKYPYTLSYTPNAIAWTEVPKTLKSYWVQRTRWQLGLLRSFCLHRIMFFNPGYGIVGLYTYPMYLFFEIFGPVVETISYIILLICLFTKLVALEPIIWAILLAWGFVTLVSLVTIFLNIITFNKYHKVSDIIRVCYLVFAEMLGFRQIRALCCFIGTGKYILNRIRGKPDIKL